MRSKILSPAAVLFALLALLGCAQVRVGTIPPPAATAKLRVYVQPVTVHPTGTGTKGRFGKTQEDFAYGTFRRVQKTLNETGIYEVVPWPQVQSALGDQEIAPHEWRRGDWGLARQVGQALHADYVLMVERGIAGMKYFTATLINIESGKRFEFTEHKTGYDPDDYRRSIHRSYRSLFQQAKGDMLALAIRKGRLAPPAGAGRRVREEVTEAEPPEEPEIPQPDARQGPARSRVVVYDLDTTERLRVAGLIVTEALREELHRSGGFTIINRQDLQRAMEEMKLGQSGLLEEGTALRLGKGLAANESVSGRLSPLGSLLVLQARRTDLETTGIVAAASLRCREGNEEDLLSGLPDLVRRLSGK